MFVGDGRVQFSTKTVLALLSSGSCLRAGFLRSCYYFIPGVLKVVPGFRNTFGPTWEVVRHKPYLSQTVFEVLPSCYTRRISSVHRKGLRKLWIEVVVTLNGRRWKCDRNRFVSKVAKIRRNDGEEIFFECSHNLGLNARNEHLVSLNLSLDSCPRTIDGQVKLP